MDGGLKGGLSSAENIFVSSLEPVISDISILQSHRVRLTFVGQTGLTYHIETATDLSTSPGQTQWEDIGSVQAISSGNQVFVDKNRSALPRKFYRVVIPK